MTGDHCTSLLLKIHADSRYGALRGSEIPQVSLQSDLLDEPPDDQVVRMLDVMSSEEANFYAAEENVVDTAGKSTAQFEALEEQYGFLGGSYDEYVKYLMRPDLPRSMWRFVASRDEVSAIAGISAVPKKDGRQCKLLMQCSANYTLFMESLFYVYFRKWCSGAN